MTAAQTPGPNTLRIATTPPLVGFLTDKLLSPLRIEPCAHLQPDQTASRFAVLAIPERMVCAQCVRELLVSVPVEHDDQCDGCRPSYGDLHRHSAVIGQLTLFYNLCEWCERDLGVAS